MSDPREHAAPQPFVHELFGPVDYDIDAAINDMIDREHDEQKDQRMTHQNGNELLARIAISQAVEPGDHRLASLLAEHSAAELAADPDSWLTAHELAKFNLENAEETLQLAAQANITPLIPGDPHWPVNLADLSSTGALALPQPVMLWARGDASLLSAPHNTVAITGSRACTGYGSHVTAELATELSDHKVTVLSGAAYGIDAVAHRTSLAQGSPSITVLASGVDRPYPAGHDQLIDRIAESGCVVSEMPPGAAPTRHRFLMRGRLIAVLAGALIVPEAGIRSGAQPIAQVANAMGRSVGAVPGPVTSAASAGCHRLIQEGAARLITSGADVLSLINGRRSNI